MTTAQLTQSQLLKLYNLLGTLTGQSEETKTVVKVKARSKTDTRAIINPNDVLDIVLKNPDLSAGEVTKHLGLENNNSNRCRVVLLLERFLRSKQLTTVHLNGEKTVRYRQARQSTKTPKSNATQVTQPAVRARNNDRAQLVANLLRQNNRPLTVVEVRQLLDNEGTPLSDGQVYKALSRAEQQGLVTLASVDARFGAGAYSATR